MHDIFRFNDMLTFPPDLLPRIIRGIIIFAAGLVFLRLTVVIFGKSARKKLSQQSIMIIEKAVFYTGLLFLLFIVMHDFGIRLSALLGAAGIVGIALGIASQTSVSNIISGLFLIGEKPFQAGDIIRIGEIKGTVLSIDLLSVKLRTFDNQFIRIPNENIIKSDVVTITRFPIRRMSMEVEVAYHENIRRVLAILRDIADKNPFILDEPEPFIMFKGFRESSLVIACGFWFVKDDWIRAKSEIMIDIKERFDAEGIEFPLPHRTLYTGSHSKPFPVRIVAETGSDNTSGVTEGGIQTD